MCGTLGHVQVMVHVWYIKLWASNGPCVVHYAVGQQWSMCGTLGCGPVIVHVWYIRLWASNGPCVVP